MVTLEKRSVLDPRINLGEQFRRWVGFFGATEVEVLETPASSGSNNASTNFDIKINDNTTVLIDRSSLLIAVPITVNKVGTGGGIGNLFQEDVEGFRCRPLEKIMQNISFKISSGSTISYQPWQYMTVLEKFTSNEKWKQETPTMFDKTQTYAGSFGRIMSPFAYRMDNPYELPRSAYPIQVTTNTPTNAVITATLLLNLGNYPPFNEDQDVLGINARPFTININWLPQLARVWSLDAVHHTQPFTNITVNIGLPTLYCTVLSIPFNQSIPSEINYPYNEVTYMPKTTTGTIPSGSNFIISSEVSQLTSVPAKIYIGAKPSDNVVLNTVADAVSTTDTFAQINQIQITFGNKTSYFSNYQPVNLFEITKNNGINHSITWSDWWGLNGSGLPSTTTGAVPLMGSIFCVDPVKDMGSSTIPLTTGLSGQPWNFQVKATFTNISPNPIQYDFFYLIVYEGVMTIKDRTMANTTTTVITNVGELTPLDIPYQQIKYLHGGKAGDFFKNMWTKIKPVLETVNKGLKDTKIISNVLKATPLAPIAPAVAALGYGEGGYPPHYMHSSYVHHPSYEGGAKLSRAKMGQAMNRYR